MIWSWFAALSAGFPYYLCGVGAILLAGGLWLCWRRLAILPRAVRATGTIVRWERQRDSEDPNVFHYFPHVRFADGQARQHEMRVDMGYTHERYPVGHPFAIRYDPKDPSRAYAANLLVMLVGPAMLAVQRVSRSVGFLMSAHGSAHRPIATVRADIAALRIRPRTW